jgi:hypothetical protein
MVNSTYDAVERLEQEEYEEYVSRDRNQHLIQQQWKMICEKGWKKSALYFRMADKHKKGEISLTINDLVRIADLLGYRLTWANFKAQELGIISD